MDPIWWDLRSKDLIPKFSKIFEFMKNFETILLSVKNNAFELKK